METNRRKTRSHGIRLDTSERACEKLKEATNATDKHIKKLFFEMANRDYSSED